MRVFFWNMAAVIAILITVASFEFGLLSAGNAFFIAAAVLAAFTAYQLIAREHLPLRQALLSAFTNPESHGARGNYVAFVMSAALGTLLMAQTLTYL